MNKRISRRNLLKASATIGALSAMQHLWPSWLPRLAFASDGVQGDAIVCVFLRGGADALNMVVPFGDENYYRARPLLAFGQPDSSDSARALELDDFFGLNPDMRPLHELMMQGHMLSVHAVGPPNVSRSHFEAMDLMERGTDGEGGADSGWLGRHLMATTGEQDSPLRAIGWGDNLQKSLHGYIAANSLQSIADYHLNGDRDMADDMTTALNAMYQGQSGLDSAAGATLDALQIVQSIDVDNYRPANGASYEDNALGRGLKQTAALLKAEAGLEVACVDHGNFDTHVAQGRRDGLLSGLVSSLANNLRAFHDDMLEHLDRVTVIVMSEFGRRVQENGGGGTDHGHGGAMYIISPHVIQQPVLAQWPGLNDNFLENGDLQITMDYRDVLGEILLKRTARTDLNTVFPGHSFTPAGVLK